MTRFSLDDASVLPYRDNKNHHDDDDSMSSSEGSSSSYYDSDEEEAHPLGFGSTRFGVFSDSDSDGDDSDYVFDEMEDLDTFFDAPLTLRRRTPILNNAKETRILLRHDQRQESHRQHMRMDKDLDPLIHQMDRIAILVKAASIVPDHSHNHDRIQHPRKPLNSNKLQLLLDAAEEQRRNELQTKLEMERYAEQLLAKQKADAHLLLSLIQKETSQARAIVEEEKREEEALLEAQRAQEHQRDLQEQAQREEEEQIENERLAKLKREEMARRAQEEKEREVAEKGRLEQERLEERKKQKEQEAAKKTEYITKAHKIVDKLAQVRKSLEPFETSKDRAVSKRRLQMKKVARGKMNTLAHDKAKVEGVTMQVIEALKACSDEDLALRQQMQAGDTSITRETTRGSRYLMDLIASTVVVRVQAEGFNGTRGDGFPLAHMLAHTSKYAKDDFNLLLTAHIYSVCPTAIPTLPAPAHGCSEQELMESLGMQKDKKGEYETFDRFLARTEGLISIVAEIMASAPSGHILFGGQNGALIWLHRFLDLLPPDLTPLPLLTAPVLVAFLTAAGHLLANKFPTKFKPMFDKINDDISKRLDSSAIGQPSATRLSKLLSTGFAGFKNELPKGAIREFYNSSGPEEEQQSGTQSSSTSTASGDFSQSAPTAAFGNPSAAPTTNGATPSTPFVGGMASDPSTVSAAQPVGQKAQNLFGTGGNTATAVSPFGTSAAAPASTPFGMSQPAVAPAQFGMSQPATAPASAPFGRSQPATTPASTPFGMSQPAASSASTPFGETSGAAPAFSSTAPAPTQPFGTVGGGFGSTVQAPATAFGVPTPAPSSGFGFPSPASTTPFGAAPTPAPATPAFGTAPVSTPFGISNAAAPSPFGSAAPAQAPTNTGFTAAPAATPFGSMNAAAPSPFGGGAGSTPVQSPFGGTTNTNTNTGTGFGFGATPAACPPASTPFGASNNANKKQPCKFFAQGRCNKGDNCRFSHVIPGQGGHNNNSQMSSPFGGGGWNSASANNNNNINNNNNGVGNKKQPCKFFAQGKCKFGANCKFSHEIKISNASQGFGGGFNSAPSSGFGGSSRPW